MQERAKGSGGSTVRLIFGEVFGVGLVRSEKLHGQIVQRVYIIPLRKIVIWKKNM